MREEINCVDEGVTQQAFRSQYLLNQGRLATACTNSEIPKFRFLFHLRLGFQPDATARVSQSVKDSHTIKPLPRIAYHTKLTVMELRWWFFRARIRECVQRNRHARLTASDCGRNIICPIAIEPADYAPNLWTNADRCNGMDGDFEIEEQQK